MRRLFSTVIALMAFAFCLSAQTADEFVARMDKEIEKGETQGLAMTMSMKIPLVGEFSTRIKSLGDFSRADADVKGEKVIFWNDQKTSWTYTASKNEIVIENSKSSKNNEEADLVKGITSGYDVSLKSETDNTWTLKCVKSKSNQEKEFMPLLKLLMIQSKDLLLKL